MKALVIAPQPFFSPRGTPYSVYYRTLVTAELGVKIDLLTYGEGDDVDIPGVRIIRIPRLVRFGKVKTGPSSLKLFLDGFLILWTVGLLVKNRYQFVHAHEEAVFFARFLKPLFRYKLVYDMHSSLPEQLSNYNFTKSKAIINLFKRLEDSSLKAADAVITICPALSKYVRRLIGEQEKHVLIENSIFDKVRLANRNAARLDNENDAAATYSHIVIEDRNPLIVYTGTLEPYQGINLLLDAFKEVVLVYPEVVLLVAGGTEEQVKHYSRLAEQKRISTQCVFTGRVPQAIAQYYNQMATLLVSPRSAGSNTPLKIYEQLASGVPLVATNIYSHTQVMDRSVAFLVEPESKDLARGILEALASKEKRDEIVKNAKMLYDKKYSRPVYVNKMMQLIDLLK